MSTCHVWPSAAKTGLRRRRGPENEGHEGGWPGAAPRCSLGCLRGRGPGVRCGPPASRLAAVGDVMDKDLVDQLIDTAQRVVASGAISANGHGNVSLRVPGAAGRYFTAGPSLRKHP